MSTKIPFQLKQNGFSKIFRIFTKCYDAVFNFLFYLPCCGEAFFRDSCVEFANLTAGDRVLDLCCGNGELTTAIARQGLTIELVGVDVSETAIETARAKARHMPITFLTANASDLPLEPSQFNKCFISLGLHHMSRYERQKVLAEVHRILIPKGYLYIIDYNLPGNGLRRLAATAFAKLDESKEAYKMIKRGNVISEVKKAGFEIENRGVICQGIIQMLQAVKN
jgi:ubiquinone/menaquinone biosynthesis C-methylase UbiE